MIPEYTMRTQVTTFDVGPERRLKYSMLLRYLQEAADRQMREDGMSYETLRDKGVVFVLTRADVSVKRLPAPGEDIAVNTWFKGFHGAEFIRNMTVEDMRGGTLAEAETRWVTVDPEKHRIVRPAAFPFPEKIKSTAGNKVETPHITFKTAEVPPEAWRTFSREIRWSDVDFNGHVNNAVYADFLCDYFPSGIHGRELDYFGINFSGEAREGDELKILSAQYEGNAVLCGTIAGRRCFEAAARCRG